MTFKGANKEVRKAERQELVQKLHRAKSYDDLDEFVGGLWNGDEEMREIEKSINSRVNGTLFPLDPPPSKSILEEAKEPAESLEAMDIEAKENIEPATPMGDFLPKEIIIATPLDRENPEPVSTNAPLLPSNERRIELPALLLGEETPTPSPTPRPRS